MEHDREPFAGDGVQDLLHQNQTLAGGEVSYASAGDCKPFAGAGRAVLRLRLDEGEVVPPEITLSVRYFHLVAAAHGGGRSDRIRARSLRDMGLHPDDHSRAVGRCGDTWIWGFGFRF